MCTKFLFPVLAIAMAAPNLFAEQMLRRPHRCDPIPARVEGIRKRYEPKIKGTFDDDKRALDSLSVLNDKGLDVLFGGKPALSLRYSGKVLVKGKEALATFHGKENVLELIAPELRDGDTIQVTIARNSKTGLDVFRPYTFEHTYDALPGWFAVPLKTAFPAGFEKDLQATFKKAIVDKKDLQGLSGKAVEPAAIRDEESYFVSAAGSYFCSPISRALLKRCFPETYAFADRYLQPYLSEDLRGLVFPDALLPQGCIDYEKMPPPPPRNGGVPIPMLETLPVDGEEKAAPAEKVEGCPIRLEVGSYVDEKRGFAFTVEAVEPRNAKTTEEVHFQSGEQYKCDAKCVCEDPLNRITIVNANNYSYHLRKKDGGYSGTFKEFSRLK